MSKEQRPFKSFKTPSERPFKTYHPPADRESASSMLFEDPQQQLHSQHQQQLRMGSAGPGPINGLMHQQQQQQQHQQQQQQHSQHSQHMSFLQQHVSGGQGGYPDPDDYLRGVPNPIMNIDPSLSSYYEDLGLDDTDNPLIRPDLLVANDSILQREQDLNIGQAVGSGMPSPANFILPSRHPSRIGTSSLSHAMGGLTPGSLPDSLSMLFDQSPQSLLPFSSSLQQHHLHQQQQQQQQHRSSSDPQGNGGTNGSHFLNAIVNGGQGGSVAGMMAGTSGHGSNGRSHTLGSSDILPSSSGLNINPFPLVKREADEGRTSRSAESPSPNGMQSPSQSDSLSPKRGLKRSVSDSSTGSASQNDSANRQDGGENGDLDPRDPAYLEKRRKNNESAKRSREARRNKEELVALRVITLEEENMKLRAEINLLDKELDELRARLFS